LRLRHGRDLAPVPGERDFQTGAGRVLFADSEVVLKSASVFSTVGRSTPLRNATSMAGSRFGSASRYQALLDAPVNDALDR